jgi:multisubunit Na+/H+ antiporter MnhC subunit
MLLPQSTAVVMAVATAAVIITMSINYYNDQGNKSNVLCTTYKYIWRDVAF